MPKKVLITGCSSGFGHSMVQKFLQAGWQVMAALRQAEMKKSLFAAELQRYPDQLFIAELDVTSPEQRKSCAQQVETFFSGSLDCLINNAGQGFFGPFEHLSEESLRQQMEVNFFAVASLSKILLPYLRQAKGRIINISSVFGFTGFPLTSAYVASKFALEGLSESLAYELVPHGVQVCLVEPGGHRTNFGTTAKQLDELALPENDPYHQQLKNFRSFRQKLMEGSGVPAENVATTVVKLAHKNQLPLRVRVGRDACFAWTARRLLPGQALFRLQKRFFQRFSERR